MMHQAGDRSRGTKNDGFNMETGLGRNLETWMAIVRHATRSSRATSAASDTVELLTQNTPDPK